MIMATTYRKIVSPSYASHSQKPKLSISFSLPTKLETNYNFITIKSFIALSLLAAAALAVPQLAVRDDANATTKVFKEADTSRADCWKKDPDEDWMLPSSPTRNEDCTGTIEEARGRMNAFWSGVQDKNFEQLLNMYDWFKEHSEEKYYHQW
ncbi:hypothetical protein MY1884_004594 [Beauveria asiatica]